VEFPVKIIARGFFPESNIHFHRQDFPPLSPETQRLVTATWEQELARNPHLRAGPILAAQRIEQRGDELIIHGGESRYDLFMGTTAHEQVPDESCHRAIGVMCVTLTKDGHYVFGRRSLTIDWGGLTHVVPAGRMGINTTNPYAAIRAEAKEELGLESHDFTSLVCVGVIGDLTSGRKNFEFVFLGGVNLTLEALWSRAKGAKSATEHSQLDVVSWDEDSLVRCLTANPNRWVPTGWVGTALATRTLEYVPFEPSPRTYEQHMALAGMPVKK